MQASATDAVAPRYAAALEYDGTPFCGWQIQSNVPSVQQAVEEAFSSVADSSVRVICAGRTDTGVHALGQVVHFDTFARRPLRAWLLGANTKLDPAIRVLWIRAVGRDFHARYSALQRTYSYRLVNSAVAPALDRNRAWWVHYPLDVPLMHEVAQTLKGQHDFSAFRASACQSKSAIRTLHDVSVGRAGERITIVVRANAFLHHMVRNIVGSLVRVGRGLEAPEWLASVLKKRDRTCAGMTAPACGLYLDGVAYPEALELPAPCYHLNP